MLQITARIAIVRLSRHFLIGRAAALNPRVRVPGGAPVLTWGVTRSGSPREGRLRPMFAPRLLVSPVQAR